MLRSRATIDSLDGLRGLAALGVVVLHIGQRLGLPDTERHLYLAVPFFFLLSGYVIARAYEDRLADGMTLAAFAVVRATRLLPLLFLSSALAWLLGAPPAEALGTALLVPSLSGAMALFPVNTPVWSLLVEVWGNAFHAVFRAALTGRMLAAFIVLGAAGVLLSALHLHDLSTGWAFGNFASGVTIFVFSYMTGIAIWRIEQSGRLAATSLLPFAALALAYGAAVAWPQLTHALGNGLGDAAIVLALFPSLLWMARGAALRGWMAQGCRVAGALSYPLYVLHYPIVETACRLARPLTTDAQRHLLIAPLLFFCVMIAWAADRWYDRPVRRLLSGCGGRHEARRLLVGGV